MATYDTATNTFSLEDGEVLFIIPAIPPGGTTPTPADSSVNGNALDNSITGDMTDNWLDGGAGIDTLKGGLGNDTYLIDEDTDVVEEFANEGVDTIISTTSYVLGANMEILVLMGTDELNGTGNDLDNTLVGNDGENMLVAGAGDDTVIGGSGSDILIGGVGIDTVAYSSSEFGIAINLDTSIATEIRDPAAASVDIVAAFENVIGSAHADILIGDAGDNGLNGGGGDDEIRGGFGSDVLDGGDGMDRMFGGLGDDMYIVGNAEDIISEDAGQGRDIAVAMVSYVLADGDVELLMAAAGTTAIDLTSNAGSNTLLGNAGVNKIFGSAGNNMIDGSLGNDVLTGGAGKDFFVFDTRLNKSTNVDVITDYRAADDTIRLHHDIFKKLGRPGKLNKEFFVVGKATEKDDYIIYNKTTGTLSYDADGSGKGAAIAFAKLTTKPALTSVEFLVI